MHCDIFPDAQQNGANASRLANTLNVSFPGFPSETMLMALDLEGVCASSGSACMVGSVVASHVLLAMAFSRERAASAIRFSLGKGTRMEEIEATAAALERIVQRQKRREPEPIDASCRRLVGCDAPGNAKAFLRTGNCFRWSSLSCLSKTKNERGQQLLIVCQGTFAPSPAAAALSKAAHFQASAPVTVRFSDGSPGPGRGGQSPDGGPRGMAIRFDLPGGRTDGHRGAVAQRFRGRHRRGVSRAAAGGGGHRSVQAASVAHRAVPGAHPLALKFVLENRVIPTSFATAAFFSNDAFIFVNQAESVQAGRYQILPVAGRQTWARPRPRRGR